MWTQLFNICLVDENAKVPSLRGTVLGCGFLVLLPAAYFVWYFFGDSIHRARLTNKLTNAELLKLAALYEPPPKQKLREFSDVGPAAEVAKRKGKVLILYRPLGGEIPPEIHPDWFKLEPSLQACGPSEIGTLIFVDRQDRNVGYYVKQSGEVNPATDGAFQATDTVSVLCGPPLKLRARFDVKGPVRQKKSREDSFHNPEPDLAQMVAAMKSD